MRHLVEQAGVADQFEIDSAGTGPWHVGESPDSRARATARSRGIRMGGTARQFQRGDFARFDFVLAMDGDNYRTLQRLAPDDGARAKIHLLRSFDPAAGADEDVPDPYYGGSDGFDLVFDVCEAACRGLLEQLR